MIDPSASPRASRPACPRLARPTPRLYPAAAPARAAALAAPHRDRLPRARGSASARRRALTPAALLACRSHRVRAPLVRPRRFLPGVRLQPPRRFSPPQRGALRQRGRPRAIVRRGQPSRLLPSARARGVVEAPAPARTRPAAAKTTRERHRFRPGAEARPGTRCGQAVDRDGSPVRGDARERHGADGGGHSAGRAQLTRSSTGRGCRRGRSRPPLRANAPASDSARGVLPAPAALVRSARLPNHP